MLKIKFGIVAVFLLSCIALSAKDRSDKKEKADETYNLINSKSYVFVAQSAMPMSSTMRHLTSGYDLTVAGDSIIAYLPYFGRVYTAPAMGSDGGIKFTSTSHSYKLRTTKHGWDINLKPKDVSSSVELNLHVSQSGYAVLQVNDASREAISFYGYIKPVK